MNENLKLIESFFRNAPTAFSIVNRKHYFLPYTLLGNTYTSVICKAKFWKLLFQGLFKIDW